jgi:uncharacterized protein with FMN-binding domain
MKKVVIVIIVIVIIAFAAFLWMVNSAKKSLEAMVYEDIDMNLIQDGTYSGETDAGLVYAKVEVAVKNHSIDNIDIIEHRNGLGSKAESITKTMVEENSYNVDAVSGATLSSETIKSAVSKALKEGYSK